MWRVGYSCIFCLIIMMFCSCATTTSSSASHRCGYDTDQAFCNPADMPQLWGNYSLEEKKQLDEQIATATKILNENVPTARLYADIGLLLYRRCRLLKATQMFEKALLMDQNNARYFYILGCVNYFSKRYDLAKDNITRSKQLGFRVDPKIDNFFRKTVPAKVDLYRAKIVFGLEQPYEKQGLRVTTIEQMLALPDDQLDLATTALILSREASEQIFNKSFDIDSYRGKIDAMVDDILQRIGTQTRPGWVCSTISRYLFFEKKFRAPKKDTADVLEPRYHLINDVLDYHKGVCMSLSILYLAIAQRMNLPIYGVVAPGHFYVRYDDMAYSINIETTLFGKNFDNDYYRKEYPNLDTAETMYFKNLTKRETLGCYLNNFGTFYMRQHQMDKAIKLLKLSIHVNPRFSEPYINLGNAYNIIEETGMAVDTLKEGLKYNAMHTQLIISLGKVYFQQGNYDDALEEFKMAQALDSQNPKISYYLGMVYNAKGYYEEAVFELNNALKAFPESVELNYTIARAYYHLKDYTGAWKYVKILRSLGHRTDPKFLKMLEQAQKEPVK